MTIRCASPLRNQPRPGLSLLPGKPAVSYPGNVFEDFNGLNARDAVVNLQPVGTGPYIPIGFEPGTVIFEPNPTLLEMGLPAFKRVELKGGIAPYAAARDVIKAGTADFAHNLQVEASALEELATKRTGPRSSPCSAPR